MNIITLNAKEVKHRSLKCMECNRITGLGPSQLSQIFQITFGEFGYPKKHILLCRKCLSKLTHQYVDCFEEKHNEADWIDINQNTIHIGERNEK